MLNHLKCAIQRWTDSFQRKALILMYHRIADVNSDPWGLAVSPKHFEEQLEILEKQCRTMQLARFNQELLSGKIPRRCVIVTFDDGYADNFQNALPSLERHDIEATIFLVSGQIGKEKEFWWDELEQIFLEPGVLPQKLELTIGDARNLWDLTTEEFSIEEQRKHSLWRTNAPEPTARHKVYFELWRMMQPLPEEEQQKVLDQLSKWRATERKPRAGFKTLTHAEASQLARNQLIEIGGHSVTHPVLSNFSTEAQKREVEDCKKDLQEFTGGNITSFAYPYGQHSDTTITILRDAGLRCACSTVQKNINHLLDPFRLPRFQALNVDGDEFEKQLSEWFAEQ